MNLSLKSGDTPALPASLFMMINGGPDSTWNLLARKRKRAEAMLAKQSEYGSKLMTFMMFNMVEPDVDPINPFLGSPTAKEIVRRAYSIEGIGWDQVEVDRWMGILSIGLKPSVYLVPTIFCGDDRATTRNQQFVEGFVPIVIRKTYPNVAGYNLISEASKSWSTSEIDFVAGLAKAEFNREPKLTPKPIFVHQQGTNIGTVADGLMYEWRKNPWDAKEYQVSEVISELKQALSEYPKMVWAQELAVLCEEPWARWFARHVQEYARTEPRIIGLPGPV